MSAPSPLWRGILWVERFLPVPRPIASDERAKKTQRLAVWVPFVAILPAFMPILLRERRELGMIAAQNRIAFEQIALVVTGAAILATIVAAVMFGVRAWRDARSVR